MPLTEKRNSERTQGFFLFVFLGEDHELLFKHAELKVPSGDSQKVMSVKKRIYCLDLDIPLTIFSLILFCS